MAAVAFSSTAEVGSYAADDLAKLQRERRDGAVTPSAWEGASAPTVSIIGAESQLCKIASWVSYMRGGELVVPAVPAVLCLLCHVSPGSLLAWPPPLRANANHALPLPQNLTTRPLTWL